MVRRGLLFNILLLLLSRTIVSGQASANATFDPAKIETGDTFALRVLFTGSNVEPVRVDFGAWASLLPAQNILSKTEWRRSGPKWVQQFTLIAFDSATLELPPLVVHDHLGNSISTNPLQLTVTPTRSTAEIAEMDDIREIVREPVAWTDYLPEGLAVLCLILGVFWYLRRRNQNAKPKAVIQAPAPVFVPVTPPHLLALQKLKRLSMEKPWAQGQEMSYYVSLSMIVREYIERRYEVAALESTTAEIMELLKKVSFPSNLEKNLENLLNRTDFVKFAGTIPPKDTHEKNLLVAQEIIEKTQPS
ncbi:MAG: hypothetical protein WCR52_14895 [Bacteroidota bacterium]